MLTYYSRIVFFMLSMLVFINEGRAQLSIPISGTSATIDFEASVPNVNNGNFTAEVAPDAMPAAGGLSTNAWTFTGFSTAADLIEGTDEDGRVGGIGIYAFVVVVDTFLGIQPGGNDFSDGDDYIQLSVVNNTGQGISQIEIDFEYWVNNDQNRSNSLGLSVSVDATNFSDDTTRTSIAAENDETGFVAETLTGLTFDLASVVAPGEMIYLRWTGNDVGGSGSRDEFGIDDIVVVASEYASVMCAGDAGPNQVINEGSVVSLNATAEFGGMWSADFGSFSSTMDPQATYTPGSVMNDTTVVLTWTSLPGQSDCEETAYTVAVTIIAELTADFTYDPAILCPSSGISNPILDLGATAGIFTYTVLSGGPDLDLDPETGIIQSGNSDEGSYEVTNTLSGCGNLVISGIVDGDLFGGVPKAVELYALTDIPDLSAYGIGTASNGELSTGVEVSLPATPLAAGAYFYVTSVANNGAQAFQDFFGFEPDFSTTILNTNGDDVVELFCRGSLFDAYGEVGVDGSGQAWEYADGWGYSANDRTPNYGDFDATNWTFSNGGLMDASTNAEAMNPMPISTYAIGTAQVNADISASFTVDIEFDGAPSTTLTCRGQVNTSLDPATCTANISYLMLLSGVDENACLNYGIDIEGVPSNLITAPGTYKVTVLSGYDDNKCWSTVLVEDKNAPIITCPLDATIDCSEDPSPENVRTVGVTDGTNPPIVLGAMPSDSEITARNWAVSVIECSTYSINFRDVTIDGDCDGDTIKRVFTVVDATNKQSSCTQTIFLSPQDIMGLVLPNDFDCIADGECADRMADFGESISRVSPLSCDGAGSEWNVLDSGNPSPDDKFDVAGNLIAIGTGRIGGVSCGTIQAGFTDVTVETCLDEFNQPCATNSPSFKVIRKWKLLDWCTGEVVEHFQIIKVLDTEAPTIEKLADMTVGVSLWDCSASIKLPTSVATDNCSDEVSVNYRSTAGIIEGGVLSIADNAKTMGDTLEVYVDYSDCCGNTTIDTFSVVVIDNVPPVVVADAHTVVSLSEYNTRGLAKVFAETFDDGSKDNCGPVSLTVRRMSSVCSGGLPGEGLIPGDDDDLENEDGVDNDDEVGDGKGTKYSDLWFEYVHFCCEDVGNTVMIQFRVCDDADMDGIYGGYTEGSTGKYIVDEGDLCNTAMVEVEVQDKLAPACDVADDREINCIDFVGLSELVNTGALDTASMAKLDVMFGPASGAASCGVSISQKLTSKEECGIGAVTREVTVTNTFNGLTQSCSQTITITVDSSKNFLVCTDIAFPEGSRERTLLGSAVWCETNPYNIGDSIVEGANLPAIEVMECAGVNITTPEIDYDNLCSEVGIQLTLDTFDFAGGGCKKILAHWEIIDQCQFKENFYVNDEINPFVPQNGYFELYVEYDLFDTIGPVIICGSGFDAECDGSLTGALTAIATDDCTTDSKFFGWNWKFDENGDGTVDHEGEGDTIVPADLGMTVFPKGGHIVTWIVSDGCGNTTSKECPMGFNVIDSKAPTPYCVDGLSSAVMLENGVTIWASDFNVNSSDNCGEVFVTIVPEKDVEGLSEEEAYASSLEEVLNLSTGKMEYGWNFDCSYIPNGISATIAVRMYATDESGNKDYCTSTFRLQDNLGGCADIDLGSLTIGGNIATVNDKVIGEVEVELMTSNPEFPKYTTTDKDGNYAFYGNPGEYAYEITPTKRDDYRNGVSTLDLLLIQKHLLSIEKLTSAYDMIAADINNDASIKASDLLQLRKLILGLYAGDVLPNNDSWRFVAKETLFGDETQPWPFDEVGNVDDLEMDMMTEDFMAVKVGDVNNSVAASGKGKAQVRNENTLILDVNEGSYQAGDEVKLSFTSSEFIDIYGYQFTLEFGKGLTFVGVESGVLRLGEGNFGLNRVGDGLITTSYDDIKGTTVLSGEELFTLTFRATATSTIGSSVKISSKITPAEAYVGAELEVTDLELRTNEGEVTAEFVLNQNEPNPFKDLTNISFNLPEAGGATLTIYDVTGKVLRTVRGEYEKGMSTILLKGLDASGVMYYQLNAGEYSATKKMIVIE